MVVVRHNCELHHIFPECLCVFQCVTFRTPAIPESPEDLSEEELEALQQQMDEDFELATGT